MNPLSLFFLPFLLVNAGLFSSEKTDTAFCEYDHDVRSYFCRHITETFPKMYYGNYHLKCGNCSIPSFGKEVFPHNSDLVSINLTASGIKEIKSNAFESLTTLRYIFLQDNEIVDIQKDAFYALREVYELHLENNSLKELKPMFLNGFEANTVVLSRNKLTEIPQDVFEGIFGMMSLDLSYNDLRVLHVDSFNHLRGLEYLDLQGNKLCVIPLGVFRHLRLLKELNLARNHFKKFNYGAFSGMGNLMALNLSYNALIEFDPSILIPLSHVQKLDISGNGLNYLDFIGLETNAPRLRQIGISDNLWGCVGLVNLAQQLRKGGVEMIEHHHYEVTNINGVACAEQVITDEKIPFETFYKIVKQYTSNAYPYC